MEEGGGRKEGGREGGEKGEEREGERERGSYVSFDCTAVNMTHASSIHTQTHTLTKHATVSSATIVRWYTDCRSWSVTPFC